MSVVDKSDVEMFRGGGREARLLDVSLHLSALWPLTNGIARYKTMIPSPLKKISTPFLGFRLRIFTPDPPAPCGRS